MVHHGSVLVSGAPAKVVWTSWLGYQSVAGMV